MSPYETNTTESLAHNAPLFASVWLALFYVLKKNYAEHRLAVSAKTNNSLLIKKN